MLLGFPKSCSLESLYTVFGSAVFIRNQLLYFEEVIGSEPRYRGKEAGVFSGSIPHFLCVSNVHSASPQSATLFTVVSRWDTP